MSGRLYLAAYDIRDPARLRRVRRVLKDYACGGQKSVFECLLTPTSKAELVERVLEVFEPSCDRFMLVALPPGGAEWSLGTAVPPRDPAFLHVA